MKTGRIVGNANGEFISLRGVPTLLVIELKDGTEIKIKSAVGSVATKVSSGTVVKSESIDGQVTIETKGVDKPIRMVSPELKRLVDEDWKNIFTVDDIST